MNIIIVGCGKVGFTLAETLSAEKHNVSVIDTNPYALSQLSSLDVSVLEGNGSSYRVQLDAGVRDCDLLIAVTNRDEVNLLCCLIAKKASGCRTVARVRDPDYNQEIDFIKDELGLSLTINPELAAATNMYNLIRCPSASDITYFPKGRVTMIGVDLPSDSPWVDRDLISINSSLKYPLLIGMIIRQKQVIIPNGQTVLQANDRISFFASADNLNATFQSMGVTSRTIRKVLIVGGSTTAYYLARRLIQSRIAVTIIDSDRKRCAELSDLLPKATIVHGNAFNEKLLADEGLETTDAFVSLTNYDEENIMLALYANRMSKAKLITKINKTNFNCVVSEIPVGSVISPKHLTAEYILQHARAMRNNPDSDVEAVYMLADDKVEVLAFYIKESGPVTDTPLMKLKIRKGILISAIIRDNQVIVPTGHDAILPGDRVLVISMKKGIDSISQILE